MKVVLFLALVAAAAAFDFPQEWREWKELYSKSYADSVEEMNRQTIWETNKKYIDTHNQNADTFGFSLAMNEFGDLDGAEFAKMYNGYISNPDHVRNEVKLRVTDLPDTVDWRTKGYVTGVKNQGQCGSCWAFSTTGSLEGQHFKNTTQLVSLSEQNLVDCSKNGNEGCEGGLMDTAFKYIISNGGIDTEASYPYRGVNGKCHFNAANVGATMKNFVDVPSKNEDALKQAVATIGPISVAIDASHLSFQFYHSGVYHSFLCSQTKLDHGVLAVGYGTDGSKDYWLVKNSWGPSWGMKGYLMMSRNRNNNCGIATSASYPIV